MRRSIRMVIARGLAAAVFTVALAAPSQAQSPEPEAPAGEAPEPEVPAARTEALAALFEAVKTKEVEVEDLRKRLAGAQEDVSRQGLTEQLTKRMAELDELKTKFEETAAGVDASTFREKKKEPFSWEQTLGRILEPVLAEIEEATSTSRKIATLRDEMEGFAEKETVAEEALANLEKNREAAEEARLRRAIAALVERWEQRRLLAMNQANAARLRLEELEKDQAGYTDYVRKFLSSRGVHLVWGIGAALAVFFVVRLSFGLLRRGTKKQGLGSRLFSVLASILSVLGALAALLVVFSAAGDLFLVGIVLIFAIGAGWAGIKILPELLESLRLVLNIGMVKEGERIMLDGVPWVVQQLGFSSRLENLPLDGAVLRLPVKRLVGLHSRPLCPDEVVFPTERGEWVALDDGTVGKILAQNPAHVTVEERGGAVRTYPTAGFLDLNPKNLSASSFRVRTRFGIDYAHQAIATREVPGWFAAALEAGLPEVVGEKTIEQIQVWFAEAGSSSLDYEVAVDLPGTAAELEQRVGFAVQRILVDVCTERELGIPFPQVTVHRAETA